MANVVGKAPWASGVRGGGLELRSRVVSCGFALPLPAGQMFACTNALAQTLVLYSVDVWFWGQGAPGVASWWFTVRRVFKAPADALEVQQGEEVLPMVGPAGGRYWNGYGNPGHVRLEMATLYEGIGQRFAIAANCVGPAVTQIAAAFEVSV